MTNTDSIYTRIEQDIWAWIEDFVCAPNAFYGFRFAPCPYARTAVAAGKVDVQVWRSGDVPSFIRAMAVSMRDHPTLTTRAMAFPPRTRLLWGMSEYVERLNMELAPTNVFLNTGIAQTTRSKYPGSSGDEPYFVVIANSLAAVLSGAAALANTDYYKDWPAEHYELVVTRRARLASQYAKELPT